MTESWKVRAIREGWRQHVENTSPEELEREGENASRQVEQNFRDAADKVRENRLRRMAERQGLRLEKSRRRDPRAIGYGTYMLVNARNNTIEAGDHSTGYGLTLDQVEATLTEQ